MPHDFYLFHEALLSLFLGISGLFCKGFDCTLMLILYTLDQINRSEVSFADFLDRSIVLVKSDLIEMFFQNVSPLFLVIMNKLEVLLFFLDIEVDVCLFDHKSEIEVEEQVHCIVDDAALMDCNCESLCWVAFFPVRLVEDFSKRFFTHGFEKLSFHFFINILLYFIRRPYEGHINNFIIHYELIILLYRIVFIAKV